MPEVTATEAAATFVKVSGTSKMSLPSRVQGLPVVKVMVAVVVAPATSDTGTIVGVVPPKPEGVKVTAGGFVPIAPLSAELSSMAVVPSLRVVLNTGNSPLDPARGVHDVRNGIYVSVTYIVILYTRLLSSSFAPPSLSPSCCWFVTSVRTMITSVPVGTVAPAPSRVMVTTQGPPAVFKVLAKVVVVPV